MLIASAKTVSAPKLDQTGGSTDLSEDKTHAMQETPIPYLGHIKAVISSLIEPSAVHRVASLNYERLVRSL